MVRQPLEGVDHESLVRLCDALAWSDTGRACSRLIRPRELPRIERGGGGERQTSARPIGFALSESLRVVVHS